MVVGQAHAGWGVGRNTGYLYTLAGSWTRGDDGRATAVLSQPTSCSADGAGNVFYVEACTVRMLANRDGTEFGRTVEQGKVYTIAGSGCDTDSGDGGDARAARFSYLASTTVDAQGNLFLAAGGAVRVIANTNGQIFGVPVVAGNIYKIAGDGTSTFVDGATPTASGIGQVRVLSFDRHGNLYFANFDTVMVIPAVYSAIFGRPLNGNKVYALAGHPANTLTTDGVAAADVALDPNSLALDAEGNLYVGSGHTNIRVIAATTGTLFGRDVVAGAAYNLAGGGSTSGDFGPATAASIYVDYLDGMVVDPEGNLFFPNNTEHRVRVIARGTSLFGAATTPGYIYPAIGDGSIGASGNGGLATAASLNLPNGLCARTP